VTVRVRFANLNSATRSVTLDAPISATVILAEVAEELVRAVLADRPDEKTISLLAISVSHLEEHWISSWNCRSDWMMKRAARAPKQAWHVGRPTVPSTRSAIASDGMRSDTAPSRSAFPVPYPTRFASLRKRSCEHRGGTRNFLVRLESGNTAAPTRIAVSGRSKSSVRQTGHAAGFGIYLSTSREKPVFGVY
jgi:hypothetical protein